MDCDVVEINCKCFSVISGLLHRHLSNFDEYKCTRHDDDGLMVEFKIGGENIRINFTDEYIENIHVGLIGLFMYRLKWFNDECRKNARLFFSLYPTVPFIIVCNNAQWKCPGKIKEAELEGDEIMNREIGDKLARELGAVKYIEYSEETGRGVKILFDEIAFAGIGKMKDDEKRRNKRKRCIKISIIALCLVFRIISYVSEFNCIDLLSLSQYYDINC